MTNYSFINFLAEVAIVLPVFLLSLSFHEFFHALAATLFGDPTPRKAGRLTLNPLAHVDFLGLFFLLIFHVGWAKPVPFDPRNFKHPKLYSVLTGLAGPLANFILALISLYLIKYLPTQILPQAAVLSFLQILQTSTILNISLGIFNLLPIPPLDGSHIIMNLLISKYPRIAMWFYSYSIFLIFILFSIPAVYEFFIYLIQATENLLKLLVF